VGTARRRLFLALPACALLACLMPAGRALAYAAPSVGVDGSAPSAAVAASMRLAQAPSPTPLPSPTPPAAPAPADEPIGNVATLTGSATVTRNNASTPLKLQDDIFLNDVLQTSANSTLGVTFNDATTFNLTANAKIAVDNYVYDDGGRNNSAAFDIAKGTVAFVAAALARTGDMKITTPSASLGIRGTTGLVEVDGTAGGGHNIKLYPDPDGRVGHIDVNDRRTGARLGSLTQGASGFTVRPGPGGRVTATPLVISAQQAARDQGIVRQVHAAQVVGRQVVTQQRALRRANPNRTNPRGNAPGQPGPQRQNNLQQRPGGPPQPALPNRAGQQGQQPPGAHGQPNVPGARQSGPPSKPAMLQRRPAPPKGKPPPKGKKR